MKKENGKKILLWTVPGLILAAFLILKLFGSSKALAFLLIACGIAAAVLLAVIVLITVTAIGLGKKEFEQKTAAAKTAQMPEELKELKDRFLSAGRLLRRVRNPKIRAQAQRVLDLNGKIIAVLEKQPEELSRVQMYRSYYLPTFLTVTEKYLTVEQGNAETGTETGSETGAETAAAEAAKKTEECLCSLETAFRKIYSGLFSDELLDLTVETRTLETVMKKDGLSD